MKIQHHKIDFEKEDLESTEFQLSVTMLIYLELASITEKLTFYEEGELTEGLSLIYYTMDSKPVLDPEIVREKSEAAYSQVNRLFTDGSLTFEEWSAVKNYILEITEEYINYLQRR